MRIDAYCDASHDRVTGMAIACSVLLSDTEYLGMMLKAYSKVSNSSVAELHGIIQTLEYIHKLDVAVGGIHLHCDSLSVVDKYIQILKDGTINSRSKHYNLWCKLAQLSEGYNIYPQYQAGHDIKLTAIHVCDVSARAALRGERVACMQ